MCICPQNQIKVEKFRVILRNEAPDYINAGYVKVSEYPSTLVTQSDKASLTTCQILTAFLEFKIQ